MVLSAHKGLYLLKFRKVIAMLLLVCLPVLFLLYREFAAPEEEQPLLEEQLPAFHVLVPLIKNDVDLSSPQFVYLMQGAKPRAYVTYQSDEWRKAASLLAKIVQQGKQVRGDCGHWGDAAMVAWLSTFRLVAG